MKRTFTPHMQRLSAPTQEERAQRRDLRTTLLLGTLVVWIYVLFWLPPFPAAQVATGIFGIGWTAVTITAFSPTRTAPLLLTTLLFLAAFYFCAILSVALYVERIPSWPFDFMMTVPLLYVGLLRDQGQRRGLMLCGLFILVAGLICLPASFGQSATVEAELVRLVASRFILGSVLFLAVLGSTERVIEQQVEARTRAEIRAQEALLDPLTGLANRRAFNEQTPPLLASGMECPWALILVDVDRFKVVNDQYGHDVGDQVLTGVAGRLRAATGEHGLAYRVGGDEFAVVMREADEGAVTLVARRIIQTFADHLQVGGLTLDITVSVGIAVAPTHGRTVTELVKAADHSMYKVKRSGRNNWKHSTVLDRTRTGS
ncbi:GGDEF domain-containing protein [Deinococcus hopiensis]|uniref:Diguanylate cyclase (GGDEF) domain-containing protein n=1 Tax=Deinococcus hopiensis KR-140 TaxID=695939 RepID=A0A1W1UBM8_9DEIO|nr:GGDEF domain-containing protein [Deinococcus hopiensis]SMB78194.1 diguanylate cyclase (GGDEF) domain-containing protein [Deinococcus hopiensis KR-140]